MATYRAKIADELLAGIQDLATQALACGEQYSGDPAEIAVMAAELRAYRAGELAPEGMVVVDESGLRERISSIAVLFGINCDDCCAKAKCRNWSHGSVCADDTQSNCRAAHCAHFGLSPEPETKEGDHA